MSRKKKKAPEGAPEWMVTFGDLMSLLLTFFILLFSISEIKTQKIYELFKSFRTYWTISAPTTGYHVEELSDVINMLSELALDLPDQKEGKEGKTRIEIEHPFGRYADVVRIDNNLYISIAGRVLFDEHSSQLKDGAREILDDIKDRLVGMPNWIRVIGHANPSVLPASSEFGDHDWLAFARAKVVKEYMTVGSTDRPGIRRGRIEVSSRGANDRLPGISLLDRDDRLRLDRVTIQVTPEAAAMDLKQS